MRSFRVLAGATAASLTVILAPPTGAHPLADVSIIGIQEPVSEPAISSTPSPAEPLPPAAEPSPAQKTQATPSETPKQQGNQAAVPHVPDMHVTIGKPFRYQIDSPADTYVAVVSGLPAGLAFHPLTSEITGTPSDSPEGEYEIAMTTYNLQGQVGKGSFVMTLTRADAKNPSVIQELLTRPERGVEIIKELVQKILGTGQENTQSSEATTE
ncbi:putative Ig domain-containing protein [Corynebacterium freiburgense]|uniref:putative Ig domain-containing protein n=1 Tax=Corynebacterium freiburgense TaxID=556548 RepID=UPI00041D21BB|nr:putative Ig domain-containing protein [Corynebacterium freiburgense]WJZ02819.1 hypothetical protein CFREI_07670 [Corynebacterium freiburgense]